jgi:hypothetical protein
MVLIIIPVATLARHKLAKRAMARMFTDFASTMGFWQ